MASAEAEIAAGEETIAIVVAGAARSGHAEVLAALLGHGEPLVAPQPGAYLRVAYGARPTERHAVPGGRACGVRPPRRADLTLPDPLLRHFHLVQAPAVDQLGPAGHDVLVDTARRGGAAVYVMCAREELTAADEAALAALAGGRLPVFVVLTPDADGEWTATDDDDPVARALDACRDEVLARVPALADAPWFPVDPAAVDTAYLRRALVDWADFEGLRRASANPPMVPGETGRVRMSATARRTGWTPRLTRMTAAVSRQLREHVTIGLADTHLRTSRALIAGKVPGGGLAGLLDEELQALSLRLAVDEDRLIRELFDQVLTATVGAPPAEGVQRRFAAAVRRATTSGAPPELAPRVLLLRADGSVTATPVDDDALWSYPAPVAAPVLPVLGLAVAGDCYLDGGVAAGDLDAVRRWLRLALQALELELTLAVQRRCTAVRCAVDALVEAAVRGGPLLP
jgi:hypothetical protein